MQGGPERGIEPVRGQRGGGGGGGLKRSLATSGREGGRS